MPAPSPSGSLPPRLLAGLVAVADLLERAGAEWLLAGSTGRALQGFAVRPADLDLEASPRHAAAAQSASAVAQAPQSAGETAAKPAAQAKRNGRSVRVAGLKKR